ncbi:methionyl-tRNA formyltransferase [Sphingomonas sp. RG327]|uniref:Methionyl-tRNA formyltransferase n=1 Tax=Sphingomonas anseongensis TaxID=2908207 RepID=A0ABT0RE43_9SPHN|nr:methionyl-tRNA formyltransferase [Sphingomonas anseongensis]MCL6678562.1 methionyl-tRNA formyltransferase [Sphingomonas anseongensis]
MRIVFMGSPDFAVPSLDALVEAGHEIACVYTQPPRPAGRGKAEQKTAVHKRAEELGLEVRCPRTLNDSEEQARFAEIDADLAVVAAYGLILPRPILEAPKAGCINVHASLLPRWRGAAPIQRAILAGDEVTGVTIMRMEEGLDTGPMLLKRETEVDRKTAGDLTTELAGMGASALVEWLDNPAPAEAQPEDGATYASKIDKSEARIDWSRSSEEIERQVRAFAPSPGAWFEANGERVKLLEASTAEESSAPPGKVLDDCLSIACGSGYLRPLRVQRSGRGVMTPGELLRGFAIPKGTILT